MTTMTGTEVLGVIEAPSQGYKCRGMVWTSFNVDCPPEFDEGKMRYLVYGTEVCPKTERRHLQGYVYWRNPRSHNNVCKIWKCWVRPAKGTPDQARTYCIKDGTYVEFGELPSQGKRTDLDTLSRKILAGEVSVDKILESEPMTYHMYGRTLNRLEDLYMSRKWRTEMTTCDWLVGPTGVGKSHIAYENFHPDTHYDLEISDKGWWEDYKQQDTVIINDFRGQINYDNLLKLVDKWPCKVPRRGHAPRPFMSKKIIITCPMTPEEVYWRRDDKDDIAQLLRRVNVVHVGKDSTTAVGRSGSLERDPLGGPDPAA